MLQQAIETCQPLIQARRHKLIASLPDQPLGPDGDSLRLAQVVSICSTMPPNIRPKAAQFGWRRRVSRMTPSYGSGIPAKALLPYLFDVFTQAERTLDRFQGRLGLGLTIVQRCGAARRPGGGQERKPRSGGEFIVRLPLSEGQA